MSNHDVAAIPVLWDRRDSALVIAGWRHKAAATLLSGGLLGDPPPAKRHEPAKGKAQAIIAGHNREFPIVRRKRIEPRAGAKASQAIPPHH